MEGGFLSLFAKLEDGHSVFPLEEHVTWYCTHRDEHKRPLSGLPEYSPMQLLLLGWLQEAGRGFQGSLAYNNTLQSQQPS